MDTEVVASPSSPNASDAALIAASGTSCPAITARREILPFIVKHSRPAEAPLAWKFLKKNDSVRCLIETPEQLAESIQREFSIEQLLAARILINRIDGLQLSPVFGRSDSKFIVETVDEQPVDAHSERGMVSEDVPPAIAFARRSSGDGSFSPKPVLLVETDDDLDVFTRLGYRAISSAGLENIPGRQIREVFAGDRRSDSAWHYRFQIVDWNVAQVLNQRRPRAKLIVDRLEKARSLYECEISRRYDLWWPNAKHFAKLKTAIEFRDRNSIKKLFKQQIEATKQYWRWTTQSSKCPSTLANSTAELRSAIAKSLVLPDVPRLSRAIEGYCKAYRGYIQPIYAAAHDATLPNRMLYLILARQAEEFFESETALQSARAIISGGRVPSDPFDQEVLRARLQHNQLILKVVKELQNVSRIFS